MSQKIRVLHTEWSGGFGGQEIRILNEMEEMRKLGIHLALATKENNRILPKAREMGFDTYILPFKRKTDLHTIWNLHKILKRDSFDIINTHSGVDTWCGGFASLGSGAKFIRTRHLSNKIHPSRFNFINSLADFIITTGESVREAMIQDNRIKPARIQSIPTGIDTEIFNPSKYNKHEMREKYKIPQNAFIVGNLGILRGFKRQDIFIEVAKTICQKHENLFFVIAGNGDMQASLENLTNKTNQEIGREVVRLVGFVKQPAEFLSTLDSFMLTSDKNEGVPQALIQALSMEIPSIAADIGSIADLHCISQGKSNFILTPNPSKEEFTKALESLICERDFIKPNREFIVENFSLKIMGEKILSIYQKLLNP
ncbi:glycosyltransferase family 4 protein [Helicobacter sp. MIT 05-5294]|uniref:glycosyltransferase family 4 protein n=1 Tax=Helicobacter sp. MIT 05-5294 TaxID=1548150 RepID=UPI00051FE7C6|nr:glycosyltransferase family 4 protein [Helicobacter sp. MIT 05-5294]TLD89200.1 glycosyltransferase family 1 protein [Helicobacter sp. MIT 05-5294]